MTDQVAGAPKNPVDVMRENWGTASRLTLSGTLALFLMTRGAKSGAGKILEIFSLDWSSLTAYAVALFGVPIVAGLCVWSFWWAKTFALQQTDKVWFARVATKSPLPSLPNKARTLAIWSLIFFVALPLIGLGILELKFLHGSFSFAQDGGFGCPTNCVPESGRWAHFWPDHGFPNLLDSPYRYDGNLTYLPIIQPVLWLAMGVGALAYAISYVRVVFVPVPLYATIPATFGD